MPYTKQPTMDTYSTEDIDLTREISTRGGEVVNFNKDEDYVNVFMEDARNKYASDNRQFILKRAGSSLMIPSAVSGTIRGSFYWADQGKLFYAVGQDIWSYDIVASVSHQIASVFTSSSGTVGFTDYIHDDGTIILVVSDGTQMATISTTNSVTQITDPDLPAPFDPNIVFFDGYIFVVKNSTGDIYNSVADDPTSWDSSNFINAEVEADYVKRIAKINNYLVVFGTNTIEYFWDAAIPTGSPIQRNDIPVKRIEYISSFARNGNEIYFLGRAYNGQLHVYKMQDFKCDPIETESIVRYINTSGQVYTTFLGGIITFQGHTFYWLFVGNKTYMLDTATGIWTRIAYQLTIAFNFLVSHAITTSSDDFSCIFALNDGTTNWYVFDESLYQDSGVDFQCIMVTEQVDFGTMNRKTMNRLTIVGDRPPIDATLFVQWTDDDYQTFSSSTAINLNQDLPCTRQLGIFRQRGFKLIFTNNTLMRLQKMVADINKGSS